MKNYLTEQGWSEPLFVYSGNGYHLIYPLPDLPNTGENKGLLKSVLKPIPVNEFHAALSHVSLEMSPGGSTSVIFS